MDPVIGAGLIGAGSSLLGGVLNSNAASEARAENRQMAMMNMLQQRDFAQNGISYRVADAERAGIHPLYALGAQTTSFAPVSVGGSANDSMGNALHAAGQDISRALLAGRGQDERLQAMQDTLMNLHVEKAGLENDLLRSQIVRMHQGGQLGPGVPRLSASVSYGLPGQPNASSGVADQPMSRNVLASADKSQEAGAIADVGWGRTSTGWAYVPGEQVGQRMEDQIIPSTMWAFRNGVLPNLGEGNPPAFQPPKGGKWSWNYMKQEWQLVDAKTGNLLPESRSMK